MDSLQENITYYARQCYREVMAYAPTTPGPAPLRRREQQKEQTRLDLALRKLAQKSMPFRKELSFVQ